MPTPGRLWRSVCLGLSWRLTMCGGRRRFIVEEDLFFWHLTECITYCCLRPLRYYIMDGERAPMYVLQVHRTIQIPSPSVKKSTQTCKLRSSGESWRSWVLSSSHRLNHEGHVPHSEVRVGSGRMRKGNTTTRDFKRVFRTLLLVMPPPTLGT